MADGRGRLRVLVRILSRGFEPMGLAGTGREEWVWVVNNCDMGLYEYGIFQKRCLYRMDGIL